MPYMSAATEADTLKQEEDPAVAQWQETPDTVEVADAECTCRTGRKIPPPLSDRVADLELYED